MLTLPLVILNSLGIFAALVWLALLGRWSALGLGVVISFLGFIVLSLAILPGLVLAAPAAFFVARGRHHAAFFFGALSLLYTFGVIAVWTFVVFWMVANRTTGAADVIPMMIWAYAVAIGPLSFMASREPDNPGTGLTMLAAQLGLVILMVTIAVVHDSNAATLAFAATMTVGYIVQLSIATLDERTQRLVQVE
jgi:hypothetical protein